MEWVEITGHTIEEAKEAALDQLGVDTEDAEFEVLEEPDAGPLRSGPGRGPRAGPHPSDPAPSQGRAP